MLVVEPLLRDDPDEQYVLEHTDRLHIVDLARQIADLKSRLQRTDPLKDASEHTTMFAELTRMEMQRKQLLERARRD